MKTLHNTLLASCLSLLALSVAQAAVSSDQAARLGTSLTSVGAEKAASADGSIPAYQGGLVTPPASYQQGASMRPDPFASEKPLLVINAANAEQYKAQLTATTLELLKRFPTFQVDVYPTHRTVALPQPVLDNTLKNATGARSQEGGTAVDNVLPGIPFPIPQTGAEAMWNFLLRYQGVSMTAKYDSWNVDAAGKATLSTTGQANISYPVYEDMGKTIGAKDTYYQMKLVYTAPARRAGEAMMLRDAANPLAQPRSAWQYLPGQRRVKLAPNLAYDTPNPGTSGSGTYDDVFVFNGALDRYDWTLVGKQEMYVPYNTYKLTYNTDVSQLTTPNHLAPQFVRWEKHRVWVVEGKLKDGARHIYHKRRFYLDEDSWVALASDQYDARGQLYRGSFAFLTQSYDKTTPDATPFMIYDLIGGTYNLNGVVGAYGGIRYIDPLSKTQWSPESLAGAGIR
ncbi:MULTISPECIES: DUF1329 domain-containing protein [Pseudomonas]|uniref:DUF1329 domain-containing protein n=1 Tax=Pseudomonas guariconensis TaxID=1288410 RepID=A0AAX0VXD6_9PSED|nr:MULTISPECIES: DUF1329 domain-containing protein [Pseudomonas]PLV18357.1 DUF1329 domain-containing protein [Pseudomonas guariconensis]PLV23144.1 DUF1329 domain-containing protein [Pseudomonas guariconensis]PLV28212.1 DUF1329 domain-containing protein [Pseudomonas guariconensis]URD44464.1 DUF1329 domain-containing protein [Pseudomonas sp. BYT-5]URK99789.1 DUF1329 domain-containing protein [Pseudomonas sp. BYT-1]